MPYIRVSPSFIVDPIHHSYYYLLLILEAMNENEEFSAYRMKRIWSSIIMMYYYEHYNICVHSASMFMPMTLIPQTAKIEESDHFYFFAFLAYVL